MTNEAAPRERDPFLEAVGRVTVAGAHLDRHLHSLLGSLAFEPTLLVLANAEGTARLIELCELALKCYNHDDPAALADVKDCLTRAKALKDKRNTVVHSLFMQAEDGNGLEAMRPVRKTLGHSVTPITIGKMESLAKEIEELQSDLFRAGWNIRAPLTGMARMHRPGEPAEAAAE
ncbi:hypothetical protein [Streptomyces sp. NRRL B-24085]|uniref:hypothetical protein n=1 Tax=Streptomyces sp. NRRL B-24085 TaxID=1709476 RepID=UPI00117D69D5|nr:hypothetical protein [Streptomyces sp. NRRL B-24085]